MGGFYPPAPIKGEGIMEFPYRMPPISSSDMADIVTAGGLGQIKAEAVGGIRAQREEITKAFLAKYELEPNEVEQIIEQMPDGIRWYIRKKTR